MNAAQWIRGGQFVTRDDGQRIFAAAFGDGAPVLMLHGFPTWSLDWSDVMPGLVASGFRVVCLDFLGFGASDKPASHAYSLFEQTEIVAEIADRFDLAGVDVVCHDYGVSVGQILLSRQLARSLPFRVRSMAFLNGGLIHGAYRPLVIQKILAMRTLGPLLTRLLTPAVARRSLRRIWGSGRPLTDEAFAELWVGMSMNDGVLRMHELIQYMRERLAHSELLTAALRDADVPLGFVWGPADPISGEPMLRAVEAIRPDASITRLEGIGHYPQIEDPEAVVHALVAFLRSTCAD